MAINTGMGDAANLTNEPITAAQNNLSVGNVRSAIRKGTFAAARLKG